ncbi:MAG TPA: NUDIX domain-containing protein [Polyangiaceae bacterium]|nr:NUDIX domain-containing protein [Polyangiaceae bacterium]
MISERQFLRAYDASAFDRVSVTVDVVLLSVADGGLHALVHRRAEHPCRDKWALPGGFVQLAESLDAAAARVLRDKAGLEDVFVEQLYTFGEPCRDPRTRVISVGYYALVDITRFEQAHAAREDVISAQIVVPWKGERGGAVQLFGDQKQTLDVAFDHAEIIGAAVKRIRGKLGYAPIGFEFLPKRFTLLDLRQVHEAVLGRRLNKDSFRRTVLASGLVRATGQRERAVDHRPAELFRFNRKEARA